MGPRDRRSDRRGSRRAARQGAAEGGSANVYRMREKLISIGDDFWIETAAGQRAYKVDGKALRVRATFKIKDTQGNVVVSIQERKARIRDTMKIEREGKPDAMVRKALVTPLRERFVLQADDLGEIAIQGNIANHEYVFEQDGRKLAEVSRRWFRVRDTYGVEIAPGADPAILLAATVAVDEMRSGR